MKKYKIPDNVILYIDISYNKYKSLLEKSTFVVLPLSETIRSTGQASFLEAMAYGKPIILSKVIGALDYIEDVVNGLFYIPGNEEDLREKIIQLSGDVSIQNKLAVNGVKTIQTKFNKLNYASEMTTVIKKLVYEQI